MPLLTDSERLGTELSGKYQLKSIVARGGMGVVYEAVHAWTGRRVAVKVLRPEQQESSNDRRVLNEARLATQLRHPNVVDVLDMGADENGVMYLVMEYLEGESLGALLDRQGRIPPAELLETMLPIVGAVATAHRAGILHRDLKPSNLFISEQAGGVRVPKLLDFGIAKASDQGPVTASGLVVGTPHYMAPEQATDGDIGKSTDIWAFGVIFHECLRGCRPFEATTPTAVLMKAVNERAPRLSEVATDTPRALAAVVDRALDRDASKRFQTADEFAHALLCAAMQDGVPLPTDPDPIGLPSFRRWASDVTSETASIQLPIGTSDHHSSASIPAVSSSTRSEKQRALGRAAALTAACLVLGTMGFLMLDSGRRQSPPLNDELASAENAARPEPRKTTAPLIPARNRKPTQVEGRETPIPPRTKPSDESLRNAQRRRTKKAPGSIAPRLPAAPPSSSVPSTPTMPPLLDKW